MTDEEFIIAKEQIKNTFDSWVIKSIDVVYNATCQPNSGTPLAVFILISCAIDAIAGFFVGRSSVKARGLGKNYKEFLKAYMPGYNPIDVYYSIRCALAHNYIIGGKIGLTHSQALNNIKFKNKEISKIINLDSFLKDFKSAVKKYFNDLDTDPDLRKKFESRFSLGFAKVINFKWDIKDIDTGYL